MSRTSVKSRMASMFPTRITGFWMPSSIDATWLQKFEVTKTWPRRGPV